MKYLSWALLLCFLAPALSAQSLEQRLFELPDLSFEKGAPDANRQNYILRVKQPLDHRNPSAGHFYQRVYLSHLAYERPTVIVTEGYNRRTQRLYELTDLLDANQVQVEHRFFGESIPDSLDYRYLDLEQATADLHHIRELLGQLYAGKWVSTGISKGGSTTIFYRYFYPNDVTVSVPYVAPINNAYEDKRIYEFLDNVGTEACRDAIFEVQKRLLKERDEVLPRLRFYARGARLQFSYVSFEAAFELAVLEYPFSFWQWGHDCAQIPEEDAELDVLINHLLDVSDINFLADQSMTAFAPHYYQSAQQMGYYGYETKKFKKWLEAVPTKPRPHAAYTPNKMAVEFDGTLLKKVNKWLENGPSRMVYINGALDTWSATAVPAREGEESLWFFMQGHGHGTARIANFTDAEYDQLIESLEKWLATDIDELSFRQE